MNNYYPYDDYQTDSDLYKDLTDEERISLAVKQVIVYIVMLTVGLLLCAILGSCTTHQQLTEHHVRTIVADMMATELQADTHTNHTVLNVDSMVSSSVRTAFAEWQSQQTERETTTETITSYVDSLGRAVRQEQRTTQRELSRQEQQRYQEQIEQIQQQMQQQLTDRDSLWSQRLTEIQQHLNDSLAAQRDLVKHTDTTKAVSWWQRLWNQCKGAVIGMVIILIIVFGKRHIKRLTEND